MAVSSSKFTGRVSKYSTAAAPQVDEPFVVHRVTLTKGEYDTKEGTRNDRDKTKRGGALRMQDRWTGRLEDR